MEIIPVIDLKDGIVVRAKGGDRDKYRAIETPLSRTRDACDVIAGLLSLYPFKTLYVADLDAIEGRGNSDVIFDRIAHTFPRLALWVDNGCRTRAEVERFLGARRSAALVLGSESQKDVELLHAMRGDPRIILSLDSRCETFLGPEALLADSTLWPERIIVMTLARVGSGAGPDLQRIRTISTRAGKRKVYAAGGVRGLADLTAARDAGAVGALVASALHDGRLSAADLDAADDAWGSSAA